MVVNRPIVAILIYSLVIFLPGCAGLEVEQEVLTAPPPKTGKKIVIPPPSLHREGEGAKRTGVYHKVNKSETIWRIAKTYGVSIEEIIKSNNIPDVAKVESNQLIFIPGASEVKVVAVEEDSVSDDFIWPIKGSIVRYFREERNGFRNPGIDVKASRGAKVQASRRGKVVFADYLAGYGYTLILDHEDGFYTVYANMGKLLAGLGTTVSKSTDIALVGGDDQKAYLHFEIRNRHREENPLHYLP